MIRQHSSSHFLARRYIYLVVPSCLFLPAASATPRRARVKTDFSFRDKGNWIHCQSNETPDSFHILNVFHLNSHAPRSNTPSKAIIWGELPCAIAMQTCYFASKILGPASLLCGSYAITANGSFDACFDEKLSMLSTSYKTTANKDESPSC